MKQKIILMLGASILVLSCQQSPSKGNFAKYSIELALQQLEAALVHTPDTFKNFGPRTIVDGKVSYITNMLDWTAGFFPGSLWYIYDYTKDRKWLQQAEHFTSAIENAKYNTAHHDVGFVIGSSFGNGYRLTQNAHYRDVIIQAARSLCTRFDPRVGCIKSWNTTSGWQAQRGWQYPVIIDNMMNLELLFNATKLSGDSTYFKIAITHADVTLQNHYRPDFSCYHVVDYDSITGEVRNRHTAQGYAHESSWARGQAWGLYGFVMCYRETGYKRYLEQAEKIACWWITHKNLPEDYVPYWDFDAPYISVSAAGASGALRDASTTDASGALRDTSATGASGALRDASAIGASGALRDASAIGASGALRDTSTIGASGTLRDTSATGASGTLRDASTIGASGALRDASAAAIASSALIELASFKTARSDEYLAAAEKTLASLASPTYMASPGENGYFILKHCVGSIPHNAEIDVPLNYADYYFVEALIRYMKRPLNNTKVDGHKGIWFTLGQFSEYGYVWHLPYIMTSETQRPQKGHKPITPNH